VAPWRRAADGTASSGKREAWGESYRVIPREKLYTAPAPLILEIPTRISV
jgi:hypothetical protein